MTKAAYAAPKLLAHGKLENVTHASSVVPSHLDATFSATTPFSALTFT